MFQIQFKTLLIIVMAVCVYLVHLYLNLYILFDSSLCWLNNWIEHESDTDNLWQIRRGGGQFIEYNSSYIKTLFLTYTRFCQNISKKCFFVLHTQCSWYIHGLYIFPYMFHVAGSNLQIHTIVLPVCKGLMCHVIVCGQ